MKYSFIALLLFLGLQQTIGAQPSDLYMPSEFQKAYKEGTRSKDGKPGPNYWQNTADYQMQVRVDPEARRIEGSQTATYYNNSPNALSTLVVRLYNDVFRKANPRASRVNPEDITEDGVDLKMLKINGEELSLEDGPVQRSGTNLFIQLAEPLESGASLEMETEWAQFIPLTNRRTGVADNTSFFVAYWYPQFAVYDDVFGWDTEDYSLNTEFYNNLANFEVTIEAPPAYTIWATGVLQNPEDVFPEAINERYQRALSSTETVRILGPDELSNDYEHASGSWVYKADEVSDFAFGLSDHYAWDAAIQRVADRDVLISSAFPYEAAAEYDTLTQAQRKIMRHFSEDVPGVPYPYPRFTSFMGLQGGGMEFPMLAYNQNGNIGLTAHEMYHTYFPMYVRVNERLYAWMDEGWADFMDGLIVARYFMDDDTPPYLRTGGGVQGTLGTYRDLPLITSSQFMDGSNYGYASYPLPSFVYSILHQHLGEELFFRAYRDYINRWAYKAPTPYDFFYTFENVSGQDLSWLWEPWFFSYGTADVEIVERKKGKLTLRNAGNRPVPVHVDLKYADGSEEEIVRSAISWAEDSELTLTIPNYRELTSLSVNKSIPDSDFLDNFSPSLAEQMEGLDYPDAFLGSYIIQGFNAELKIEKEDNFLMLRIPAAGIEGYLVPQDETGTSYLTLKEDIEVAILDDPSELKNIEVFLKQFGVRIRAVKQ